MENKRYLIEGDNDGSFMVNVGLENDVVTYVPVIGRLNNSLGWTELELKHFCKRNNFTMTRYGRKEESK